MFKTPHVRMFTDHQTKQHPVNPSRDPPPNLLIEKVSCSTIMRVLGSPKEPLYDRDAFNRVTVNEEEVEQHIPEYIRYGLVSSVEIDQKFRRMIMNNLNDTYCYNEFQGWDFLTRIRVM
ncbi:hypothetical protein RF11_02371 [Thelohanellus kitauei]|uniref:Uncharacterized protein n=1 Tax=Thelohanellus kitauei TaxID=669202 RepID=A0A0C2M7S7_THEKT|nr:hypothetical protein RF11_02371 [Thelohanellus kitauei]